MSEVVTYTPSHTFKEAATFLSNSSSLASTPSTTKLELYGLYKLLTVSAEPEASRPSIFSPTERAKYDAWKSTGLTWRGKESEAEARYIDIARSLGWMPGTAEVIQPESSIERTAEDLLADGLDDDNHGGEGGGMGLSVSIMQREEVVKDEESLHSMAINGDVQRLEMLLYTNPDLDVNTVDEYGFTALHLACDRGHVAVVTSLLRRGADANVKDSDGLSPLDLALEAEHEDIVALLENYQKAG